MSYISAETVIRFLIEVILVTLIGVALVFQEQITAWEKGFWKRSKRNIKVIKNMFKVLVIGRKKYMLVVLKSPGRELQRIHILNDIRKIGQLLDAEKIRKVRICKDVQMCYDIEAFNKQKPFVLTDEYASKFYYGDVIFFAMGKDGYPRSLTFKELDLVEQYIQTHRTDKRS